MFTVSKAKDVAGKEIEPVGKFLPGVVGHPAPYVNRIEARSAKHAELIRGLERRYHWRESDWETVERSDQARSA